LNYPFNSCFDLSILKYFHFFLLNILFHFCLGAKADKFFVLLKGSVLVFLAKAPEVLQSEIKEELAFFEEKNPKSP